MKLKIAVFLVIGIGLFWACHLEPEDDKNTFEIVADSSWLDLERLTIILVGDSGKVLDTLFDDSLNSLKDLKSIPADAYAGGKAVFHIVGFKDGKIFLDQVRHLEAGGKVTVDTVSDWNAMPTRVEVNPESLILELGAAAVELQAVVFPAYADNQVEWKVGDPGTLDLIFDTAPESNRIVKVLPKKPGRTSIIVTSRSDTTRKFAVPVNVVYAPIASLNLERRELLLYQGGPGDQLEAVLLPASADQAVSWVSRDSNVVMVDDQGRIQPRQAGSTSVLAASPTSPLKDSAYIVVKLDRPLLNVTASKNQGPIHTTIVFSPSVSQEFGAIIMYKWDLDGDGAWDDSLPGPWPGPSTGLPALSREFAQEGDFHIGFHVRDEEGNVATKKILVQISNQPPRILSLRPDTTISIKDSVSIPAEFSDPDGKIDGWVWDYDGDGTWDDSGKVSDSLVRITGGYRYMQAGRYSAILKARDEAGKTSLDSAIVTVVLDPPVADAGKDTTEQVGRMISIHARGEDGYGSIAKREMQIGGNPFVTLSKQDTTIRAPDTPTVLIVVIRVTDDDGLTDEDTLKVSVVYSSDANLSGISPSIGQLEPRFNADVHLYSLAVGYSDSILRITPTSADANAKISVNGVPSPSGSLSNAEKLKVGGNPNAFQVVVTAQDGRTQKVYTVSPNRAPSQDAALASLQAGLTGGAILALKPTFASAIHQYQDTVSHAESSIVFIPTASHGGASITVNDNSAVSGLATTPLPLQVGENAFSIVVTAQDEKLNTAYMVRIVRLAKLVLERRLGRNSAAVRYDSLELPISAATNVSASAVTGFRFVGWSGPDGTVRFSDTALPNTAVTVVARVGRALAEYDTNTYTLAVTGDGHGTVSPSGVQTVRHGASIPISATPSPGYDFESWSVTGPVSLGNAGSATTTAMATGNGAVLAQFALKKFTIAIHSSHGSVTRFPDQASYDSGTSVQLAAKPDTGYHFAGWNGAITDTANPISVLMDGNKTLTAVFPINTYTLSTTLRGSGTISRSPAKTVYNHGDTVTLTAIPNSSYRFGGWTGDALGMSPSAILVMDGAKSVHADFIKQSTVTLRRPPDCNNRDLCIANICGESPSITADAGTVVSITAPNLVLPGGSGGCAPYVVYFSNWLQVTGNSSISNPGSQNSSLTIGTENSLIDATYR